MEPTKKTTLNWKETEAGHILKDASPSILNGLKRDFEDGKLKGTRKELDEIAAGERKAYFYGVHKVSRLAQWLRNWDQAMRWTFTPPGEDLDYQLLPNHGLTTIDKG
jgi:hypothetical protein